MNKTLYLKKISFVKYFISLLLFLSGLYFLIYVHIFFGLVFTSIGFNMLLTSGVQVDFDLMMYREVRSVFGVHIGKWKKLPTFDYVSVFKTTESNRVSVATASTVMTEQIFVLNLFYQTNRYITFYKTTKKTIAFEKALYFSRVLNIRILDATHTPSVWVQA